MPTGECWPHRHGCTPTSESAVSCSRPAATSTARSDFAFTGSGPVTPIRRFSSGTAQAGWQGALSALRSARVEPERSAVLRSTHWLERTQPPSEFPLEVGTPCGEARQRWGPSRRRSVRTRRIGGCRSRPRRPHGGCGRRHPAPRRPALRRAPRDRDHQRRVGRTGTAGPPGRDLARRIEPEIRGRRYCRALSSAIHGRGRT